MDLSTTFYEANAGTGKTTRLTEYILDAVQKGIPLQRICALTFTLKAANEMLDRLRSKIGELVSRKEMDPLQMQMAGRCFVGTIHAFCLQIVTRYAPDLDLPPIFEVDPAEEKFDALFENRWDEYYSRLLSSAAPADQAVIRELGISPIRSLAEILVKTRHPLRRPEDEDISWLVEDVADVKRWKHRKGTWGWFTSQIIRDYEKHRHLLFAVSQKNMGNNRQVASRVKDILACKTDSMYRAVELLMSGFVRPFLQEYHSSGYVRYDDLLVFARKLLGNRYIRKEMKERYDLVLVDEMQDTDAVQYEIILCLCEKKDTHHEISLHGLLEGQQMDLEPGKLFVVGDPKQSIYSFRNADLTAYDSIKTVLHRAGAEIKPLSVNYRSCPNLVSFTNRLATVLFPDLQPTDSEFAGTDLCRAASLEDCVHLIRIHSPDADRTHLRILSEANWIAQKIKTLVESGQAAYGDFGVLLRKLVHSHLYVDALASMDIPVVIEGERFFYRSQEVIDFINLLKCIVDPMDEPALAGTLRSPLFGMTDREVAYFFREYQKNGHLLREAFLSALGEERSLDILKMADSIFDIRKRIHQMNAFQFVQAVLKELPVLSVAGLSYGSYRNTVAPLNILRIYRHAMEAQSDPAYNLFHFVSVLTEFSREGKEKAQEPLADEGLNAVRMMSIHNSKGLDFPIVFVPLTDYDVRQAGAAFTDIVHRWSTDTTGLKIMGITESNYLRLRYDQPVLFTGEEPVDLDLEERRVLYVASTRAKREVYFCCLDGAGGKSILNLLRKVDINVEVLDEASSASSKTEGASKSSTFEAFGPVLETWRKVQAAGAVRGIPRVAGITAEAEKQAPGEAEWNYIQAEAKRSGGTLTGLLCHAALEKWDRRNPEEIADLIALEKQKYIRGFSVKQVESAVQKAKEMLQQFLLSPAGEWFRTVEIVGREVPLTYFDRSQTRILSGKIDLLAREQNRYWLVDYKTDTTLSDVMRRRYSEQMRLYKEALKSILSGDISPRLLLIHSCKIVDL